MNKHFLLVLWAAFLFSSTAYSQLQLKLQPLQNGKSWGVYVRPCHSISPSANTVTGTGQITLVGPKNARFVDLLSHSGTWRNNSFVSGPVEAPDKTYHTVGFVSDMPQIFFHQDFETLLFSFRLEGEAGIIPQLMDNATDPFSRIPNASNTNVGNEISVIDFGIKPAEYLVYIGNFSNENPGCTLSPVFAESEKSETEAIKESSLAHANVDFSPLDISLGKLFTISPNPAFESVRIDFRDKMNSVENGMLRLWSSSGRSIGELEKNKQSHLELNVLELPHGSYQVSYEENGKLLQKSTFLKL